MLIGITGERLAGKTTVAEYIRDKYGFILLGCPRSNLTTPL